MESTDEKNIRVNTLDVATGRLRTIELFIFRGMTNQEVTSAARQGFGAPTGQLVVTGKLVPVDDDPFPFDRVYDVINFVPKPRRQQQSINPSPPTMEHRLFVKSLSGRTVAIDVPTGASNGDVITLARRAFGERNGSIIFNGRALSFNGDEFPMREALRAGAIHFTPKSMQEPPRTMEVRVHDCKGREHIVVVKGGTNADLHKAVSEHLLNQGVGAPVFELYKRVVVPYNRERIDAPEGVMLLMEHREQ